MRGFIVMLSFLVLAALGLWLLVPAHADPSICEPGQTWVPTFGVCEDESPTATLPASPKDWRDVILPGFSTQQ